jgi:hypothetical protein
MPPTIPPTTVMQLPELAWPRWQDTNATLHLWTQIVGKIRLTLTPWTNHSWHTTLYVTARGLTTSTIPYEKGSFQIDFDFADHVLLIQKSGGALRSVELKPRTVADFYRALMQALEQLDIRVQIHRKPNELPDPVAFDLDSVHQSYDPGAVQRLHAILLFSHRVFTDFRTAFLGKVSPVHFFWGSFDLAVTRFSGRRAPLHPGGVTNLPNSVAQEAYSHEVSSAGFWPGNESMPYPVYYSYAYPEPAGFRGAKLEPAATVFNADFGEFILPYDAVRASADPAATLMQFLQSTYGAAADGARWDRAALECSIGVPGLPRSIDN